MRLRKVFKWIGVAAVAILSVVIVLGIVLRNNLMPPELSVPARSSLVLRNVYVVNPGVERRAGMTVTTNGSAIESVSPTDPSDSGTGPYDGLYVLPGLIDMHVHFPPRAVVGSQELWAIMFLAHGVTTVRDMGSADGSIFDFRKLAEDGELPSPRIYACGLMIDGSPPAFPSNHVVTTADEARQIVDQLAARGADFIKAYSMLTPECIEALKEQADHHGLKVVGHVPVTTPIESGFVNDVQHLTGIPQPSDPEELVRKRAEWSLEDALATDDARIAALTGVFREHDMAYTPTLINPRMRRKLCGPLDDPQDPAIDYLPSLWQDTWGFIFGTPYTPGTEWETKFELQREKYKEITYKFHTAGIPIHAGTDTMMPYVVPGRSLHGELEELVDAGLTIEEAWACATTTAGAYLSDDGLGKVAAGAPADFLVYSEDPTQSLENLDTLIAVVAGGRVYTREYLDAATLEYKEHFHGALYESVMGLPMEIVKRVYQPD